MAHMQLTQLQVSDIFPDDPKRVAMEMGSYIFVAASVAVPILNRILYQKNRRFLYCRTPPLCRIYCFRVVQVGKPVGQ